MTYNTILTTVEDGVGHMQLALHETRNATSDEQFAELAQCLNEWEYDDNVTVVVFSGTEDYFSAGLDLQKLKKNYDDQTVEYHQKVVAQWYRRQLSFPKPIIAALAGHVIGGGADFAVFSDIRVASENLQIGLPQIKFGWIPYFDPLTRIVGEGKAKELLWTGEIIGAEEAEKIGLVNKVVPRGTVIEEAIKMARAIAKNGTKHMTLYKEMMNQSRTLNTEGAFTYCQTTWRAIEGDPKIKKKVEETVALLAAKAAKSSS